MSPVSRLIWFEIHCGINNLKYGLWLLAQHRCVYRCVTVRRCVSSCSQLVESSLSVRSFFSKTEQDETQTLFQPQTPDKTRNIYRKKLSAYLFFAKRRLFPKRLHGDAALLRPGVRRVPTHLVETSSDGHRSARRSLHLLFLSEKWGAARRNVSLSCRVCLYIIVGFIYNEELSVTMNFTTADIKVLEAAFSFSRSQETLLQSVCSVHLLLCWTDVSSKIKKSGSLCRDRRTTWPKHPNTPGTNCSGMSQRTKSWPPDIDGTCWTWWTHHTHHRTPTEVRCRCLPGGQSQISSTTRPMCSTLSWWLFVVRLNLIIQTEGSFQSI